jgi:AraC-like DNA-binding protein
MSILQNPSVEFVYAGLFQRKGEWIHPERVESTYEIIYVTSGEVFLEDGGKELHLTSGQLLILSPNQMHRGTRTTNDVAFYWLHFHLHGELPFDTRLITHFEGAALFREVLHYNNLPVAETDLVNALLLQILAMLAHLSRNRRNRYDEKAERIYEWTRIHALSGMTVGQIADHFGYSTDHVTRICKRAYGIGVRELIDRFLVARAKELLCNTDKYVKEIAAELNFPNDKAFIGFFHYHEGIFPSELRQRLGKTHMNSH